MPTIINIYKKITSYFLSNITFISYKIFSLKYLSLRFLNKLKYNKLISSGILLYMSTHNLKQMFLYFADIEILPSTNLFGFLQTLLFT